MLLHPGGRKSDVRTVRERAAAESTVARVGPDPQRAHRPRQGAGAAHHALRSVLSPSPSPSPRCWRSTSCTQVSPLNLTLALAKVLAQHIMHSGQSPQPHPRPRQGAGAAHHALRSVPSPSPSPSPRCWRNTSCTQVSPLNLTLALTKVLAQHIMHSGQYPHPRPRQGAGAAHHALRSVPSTSPRCWRSTSCTQVSPLNLAKVLAQHIMHSGQSPQLHQGAGTAHQFHPKVCFVKAFLLSSSLITDHGCVHRLNRAYKRIIGRAKGLWLPFYVKDRLVVLVDYFTGGTNPHHEDLLINIEWLCL